ncbi:PelD GGDEF domain-containing protein [Vibrio penaeicida]|nr:PelD GGDEF domain-containing protein [Vibrio penaeicida]RTZ22390.1 hypothetical protein EKN09_14400 [Vibrio penaeicida]
MRKFLRHLVMGFKHDTVAWLETLVVAIISTYVWTRSGVLLPNSHDSFLWPIIGPLLISLRYGFAKGVICALAMSAMLAALLERSNLIEYFPSYVSVGMMLIIMIAGEFRDQWDDITQKNLAEFEYINQRRASLAQSYQLLKVSHDQLEQRTAGQTVSLRASVSELQKIATLHNERRLEFLGEPILNLLSEIGGIEVGGIYSVDSKDTAHRKQRAGYEKLNPLPHAEIGTDHLLDTSDPMFKDMMERKQLLSPAKLDEHHTHSSRYQLCIPMVDTHDDLQGCIVAESAKFFMLTPANIALLSLVANHAADLLCDAIVAPILQESDKEAFLRYIDRAEQNRLDQGIDSTLVYCVDHVGTHHETLQSIVKFRRGADVYWSFTTSSGKPALAVLLPLTNASHAAQYVGRLEKLLQDDLGDNRNEVSIWGPWVIDRDDQDIDAAMRELGIVNDHMAIFASHRY